MINERLMCTVRPVVTGDELANEVDRQRLALRPEGCPDAHRAMIVGDVAIDAHPVTQHTSREELGAAQDTNLQSQRRVVARPGSRVEARQPGTQPDHDEQEPDDERGSHEQRPLQLRRDDGRQNHRENEGHHGVPPPTTIEPPLHILNLFVLSVEISEFQHSNLQ